MRNGYKPKKADCDTYLCFKEDWIRYFWQLEVTLCNWAFVQWLAFLCIIF